MKSYHGIDLHSSRLTMHTIVIASGGEGKNCRRSTKSFRTDKLEEEFFVLFGSDDIFCVEASTCTAWFAEQLRARGCRVIVVNPLDFKDVYLSDRKTDKIDAKKLAEHLIVSETLPDQRIQEVSVPNGRQRAVRKLFALYDFFKKEVNGLENQILSVFASKCLSFSFAYFKAHRQKCLSNPRITDEDRDIIGILEEELESALRQKEKTAQKIKEISVREWTKEMMLLVTIPGFSIFTASAVMSDVIDVGRFKNAKHFCSYLSAAPKIDSSNKTTRIGGLSKKGRKTAFVLVLQSLVHINRSNKVFQDFQSRLSGKPKCKIRAAIVRKTFTAVYFMLRDKKRYLYEDLRLSIKKIAEIPKLPA